MASCPNSDQPEDWGLADHALDERIVCRAAWNKAGGAAAT